MDDQGEWSTPKSRKWRGKQQPQSLPQNQFQSHPQCQSHKSQSAKPPPHSKDMTLSTLLQEFQSMRKRWENTECAKRVDVMVRRRGNWMVESAVCIGIGSFSAEWEHRYRSLWQLVLFLRVVDVVSPTPIQLYAQEPAFNTLDTSLLQSLNITVLPTGIESHITPHTFVFAPFVDWYILLPTFLKDQDPELYIGNQIITDYSPYAENAEKKAVLDECNELGRKFLQGRECKRAPEFELHGHALNGLMVYWKEEDDVEEQD